MSLKIESFMTENLSTNDIENDDLNSEENDYKILITRLKEIKKTIALLEKTIFK